MRSSPRCSAEPDAAPVFGALVSVDADDSPESDGADGPGDTAPPCEAESDPPAAPFAEPVAPCDVGAAPAAAEAALDAVLDAVLGALLAADVAVSTAASAAPVAVSAVSDTVPAAEPAASVTVSTGVDASGSDGSASAIPDIVHSVIAPTANETARTPTRNAVPPSMPCLPPMTRLE